MKILLHELISGCNGKCLPNSTYKSHTHFLPLHRLRFSIFVLDFCGDGDIRIVGSTGRSGRSGRVEICFNEIWGTICNSQWTSNDAEVVCRELGWSMFGKKAIRQCYEESQHFLLISGALPASLNVTAGAGPIHRGQFACSGTESRLSACPSGPADQCTHSDDAGVVCQPSK